MSLENQAGMQNTEMEGNKINKGI